jgi:hypothetical protein
MSHTHAGISQDILPAWLHMKGILTRFVQHYLQYVREVHYYETGLTKVIQNAFDKKTGHAGEAESLWSFTGI